MPPQGPTSAPPAPLGLTLAWKPQSRVLHAPKGNTMGPPKPACALIALQGDSLQPLGPPYAQPVSQGLFPRVLPLSAPFALLGRLQNPGLLQCALTAWQDHTRLAQALQSALDAQLEHSLP